MALPDSAKLVRGTTLVFSNSGEYSPTGAGQPTGTDADIDLGALGISGVARQSVKLDLGSANLDIEYEMMAYIEWHSAPTAGGTVDFYLGWSDNATAGSNNPANLSGTDAVFQGYGADTASGTEALKQLDYVGSLVATADADVQVGSVGMFAPKARYVCLVVVNNSSVALANTDAIETAVTVTPITTQIQD
jgi:hypothetical protein